jgi:hypothetical protein
MPVIQLSHVPRRLTHGETMTFIVTE